jgi:hypothetical protein
MEARPYSLSVETNDDDLIDLDITDDIGQASLVGVTPEHALALAAALQAAAMEILRRLAWRPGVN